MQTCSLCHALSPDHVTHCKSCQADLTEYSTTVRTLKRFRENPRIQAVTIVPSHNSCSYCYEQLGTYPIDQAPTLPHKGCSNTNGCRCFYIPALDTIYP